MSEHNEVHGETPESPDDNSNKIEQSDVVIINPKRYTIFHFTSFNKKGATYSCPNN